MIRLLAQGVAGLDAQAPPPLPGPAFWPSLFLERPALAALLAMGVSLVAFAVLTARGRMRQARIAVALGVLAAALLVAVSVLVVTDRERMDEATRRMIRAVAAADTADLDLVLTPDAVLLSPLSGQPLTKSEILAGIAADFRPGGVYEVREHRVLELQAAPEGPDGGRVQVKVRITPADGPPTPAWVRIDFERAAEGEWRVGGINVFSVGGIAGRLR
jgi:ketosteroid isomerase-like protein